MKRSLHAGAAALLLLSGVAGCLDNKLEDDGGMSDAFLAQQNDFADYKAWMTYENNVTTDHGGLIGTTTVYLNKLPAPDAAEFEIGTILLKTQKPADSDKTTVHAMSKRSSTYNPDGAHGWEYFELVLGKSGLPYILWRGSQPPTGEQYQVLLGGSAMPTNEGNCNDCHAKGKDGMLGDDISKLLQ